jgi:subtilisin family serine protease
MKTLSSFLVLSSFALVSCSAPSTVATPAPAPVSRPTTPAPAPTTTAPAVSTYVPAVARTEAPTNWHLLDQTADKIPGVSADRAMKELLANKTPQRQVLVAIIDSGVDTAHVDLRANLWTNTKEIPGNKRDDDNDGYVDDVRGWNFIGGADGKNVDFDTFEITREFARCHAKAAASGAPPITDEARCKQIDADFAKEKTELESQVGNIKEVSQIYTQIVPVLKRTANTDSLTAAKVRAIQSSDPMISRARQIFLQLDAQGATPAVVDDALKSIEGRLKYGLNPDFDPRPTVGDKYTDVNERRYGNSDVTGPDSKHGTHVAGIIGAVRGNSTGVDGIAPNVRLMSIRTVPDGDERDKDVANAIRYAVDAGAQIISMSFGKSASPYKSAVDEAVKYADSKGVLMIHAAGNDGEDLASNKNFPNPMYTGGGRPVNWIEVGASSWKGGDGLAAPFSNYGKAEVDVFAPGVDIYSTVPGNKYERESGTSMAAPVVSGIAALLMSYFPNLTATDVRRIIVSSVAKHDQLVVKPGTDADKVPFNSLSVTGGIVNAYNAVKMAEQMSVRP